MFDEKTIAVLCAASNSTYHDFPECDVYDSHRDARSYPGGLPIIAHPPCRGWSATCRQLAKPAPGELELGLWCVEQVQRWGGVVEQPAYSHLFAAAGVEHSMRVNLSWFGHPAIKKTWLYFSGIDPLPVPPLQLMAGKRSTARWDRMSKARRASTPPAMCRWLIDALT